MADKSENDLVVKPQQLIGGINGMILQMHKFQVELEESKQKNVKQTDKIKALEQKNEEWKNEINELTKTKERLTEQSGFFQKSLNKKKAENAELLERLKQAEIQLGESGSVLATVRNLESKNEILSEKMSSVLLNTEEEIAKAKTDRGRYIKLLEETSKLNKRNAEMQNELSEAKGTGKQFAKQAMAFVEKSEKLCSEISKTLDEIQRAKQEFSEFNCEKDAFAKKAKIALEENALMQQENSGLKQKTIDLEKKNNDLRQSLKEQQNGYEILKEQLMKTEGQKQEVAREVDFLQKKIQEKIEKSNVAEADQNAKSNQQYEALQQQLKELVESYGQATQQLGRLRQSVDESKDLLKANIEKEENADEETDTKDEVNGGKIDQDYVAVVVEMQSIFQQFDIRDEELASLETIAGIQRQRFGDESSSTNEECGVASSIRGLVAIKDSQISTLMRERDELCQEIAEKKKIEYRLLYQLSELRKENDEILAKMEACQVKYRKLKEEKEDIRQNLLVKNAAEKITHSYVNKLKNENEQCKANLQTQKETIKQKFQTMKEELDGKLEAKNDLLKNMQEKIVQYQREREMLKNELNSRQKKDNAIKEQIISMFGK